MFLLMREPTRMTGCNSKVLLRLYTKKGAKDDTRITTVS